MPIARPSGADSRLLQGPPIAIWISMVAPLVLVHRQMTDEFAMSTLARSCCRGWCLSNRVASLPVVFKQNALNPIKNVTGPSESLSVESRCRHGLRSARAALAIDGSELDLCRVSKDELEVCVQRNSGTDRHVASHKTVDDPDRPSDLSSFQDYGFPDLHRIEYDAIPDGSLRADAGPTGKADPGPHDHRSVNLYSILYDCPGPNPDGA